jgi:hypothetical protein
VVPDQTPIKSIYVVVGVVAGVVAGRVVAGRVVAGRVVAGRVVAGGVVAGRVVARVDHPITKVIVPLSVKDCMAVMLVGGPPDGPPETHATR